MGRSGVRGLVSLRVRADPALGGLSVKPLSATGVEWLPTSGLCQPSLWLGWRSRAGTQLRAGALASDVERNTQRRSLHQAAVFGTHRKGEFAADRSWSRTIRRKWQAQG
jgi:hypothetical protein